MSIDTRKIIGKAARSVSLFEGLESRQLMSSGLPADAVRFENHELIITGTKGDDQIHVSWTQAGRKVRVRMNGKLSHAFDGRQIWTTTINAGNGDNRVTVDPDYRANVSVSTGKGDDTIVTALGNDGIYSGGGADRISTQSGNDIVWSGSGNDTINGGAGNDQLMAETGNDVIDTGGTGTNSAYGGAGANKIVATSADHVDTGTGQGGVSKVLLKGASAGSGGESQQEQPQQPQQPENNGGNNNGGSVIVSPNAPHIAINALQGTTISAGHSFHIEATGTTVPNADVEDADFTWDFGDSGSKYNQMPGFNGAHVYDRPGTYTVKLTVVAPGGETATQSVTVTVTAAATAKLLYVAADGNDNAAGTSSGTALRTLGRAIALADANTTIQLRRGDTFWQSSTLMLKKNGLTISTYGSGNNPVLMWTGARDRSNILWVDGATSNVTIRGLTFDSIYNGDTEQTGMPTAILAGGHNLTIRENTFLNIGYCINSNQFPTGMLVQDNSAPSAIGVRDYFCWTQGNDIVIVGNRVANSTREHNVRCTAVNRLNICFNDLTNLDRVAQGDGKDNAKGTIACQKGTFCYIADNTLHGPAGVGPLGAANGLGDKAGRTTHARVEDNVQYNGSFYLQHGAEHVTLVGNKVYNDNGVSFDIVGWNAQYGRGNSDIVFDGNLGVNNGVRGNFLVVEAAASQITLIHNVFVAPYLTPGSFGTSAVFVNAGDLSGFSKIDGNTWPAANRSQAYAEGGVNFVDSTYSSSGHKTPSEWNGMWQVGDDSFEDVSVETARLRINAAVVAPARMAA